MKMIFYIIVSLGLLSLHMMNAKSALAEIYPFRSYSVDEGLPSSIAEAVYQDSRGYLWFGTYNGVSRFDGSTFTSFSQEDGLCENYVLDIIEDSGGCLWFCTKGGGVSRFDGDRWITFTEEDGLAGNYVFAVAEDNDGNLWFGCGGQLGGGITKYDGAEWTIYREFDGFSTNNLRAIIKDSRGDLWFGTWGDGVIRYDGAKWANYTVEDGLAANEVLSLFNDDDNNIWVGTSLGGISRFDGNEWTGYLQDHRKTQNEVLTILQDTDGRLWAGTWHGLTMFDGTEWINYDVDNGLVHNAVCSGTMDREGNLWFGTWGGGVSRFSGFSFTTYTVEDGLAHNSAQPLLEDSAGNVWFATLGKGVCRFDGDVFTSFTTGRDGLVHNSAQPMLEDSRGNIWFGGNAAGVSKYDGDTWENYDTGNGLVKNWIFTIYEDSEARIWFGGDCYCHDGEFHDLSGLEGPPHGVVEIIHEDRGGVVWFATWGDGVYALDGGSWARYTTRDGLADNTVKTIFEDSDGNLWFGTWGRGVSRYDGTEWITYTGENGSPHDNILSVTEDSAGNLWFAFRGGGIGKFDGKRWTRYTTEDGLSSNICLSVIPCGDYIFVKTSRGLSRFDGEYFKVYSSNDGLATSELTSPLQVSFSQFCRDSRGELWFGSSQNGVTRFEPGLERPNRFPPPVYLTGFRIFGKDTLIAENTRLKHFENNLRFDFVGISLSSLDNVVFRYRLSGLEEEWHETRTRSVSYPYLPPGDYAFSLSARNEDGLWSENPVLLNFAIEPPFWETLWFRILSLLTVSAALFIMHRARVAHLTLELEHRQSEEALRKTEEDYESLVENVNGIIYSLSPSGSFTFVSSQWRDMLGYDPEKVENSSFRDYIHPDHCRRYSDFLSRMERTGERMSVDYMIRHRDSGWRWHSSTGSAIMEDGSLSKFVCVAIDITERKQAEEALRESEERFRTFMETASDFMYITDRDGRFVYVNDSMARNLAYPRQEMTGMRLGELASQKQSAVSYEAKMRELVSRGKISFETAWSTGKGREIIGKEVLVAIRSEQGEFMGARGVFHDLTEQREAEKRMRIAERASRLASIGVMAAGITHEINQPLTTINFAANRLAGEVRKRESAVSSLFEEKLELIISAIKRIDEIIRHMRSFWITSGKKVEETIELNGVVENALSIINRQLLSHGINTEISFSSK